MSAGQVYGVAGKSLEGTPVWAANEGAARNGAAGERRTAAVLGRVAARTGITALHDLNVPGHRYKANIDHVLVSGRNVLVIDSKQWQPAFYWTARGHTRAGMRAFPYADKATMGMIFDRLGHYLGSPAHLLRPVVAVWPSRPGTVTVWAARMPGARLVPASDLERVVNRFARTGKPADPRIVGRLADLLN